MTYSDAIKFLYSLRLFGAKFGLENTFRLAELCGNPHNQLNFIHVAGTNGKGSTCAMLESIYRCAGYKTGLFTSPHLVSFTERIQINRTPISQEDVARLAEKIKGLLQNFTIDHHPTFFEVVTVMALCYFAEKECDVVIWETGLGGRLDATNIVTPLASVITNIGLDHQQWLGPTIAHIAAEKAGIIKSGIPVITAADEPEALDVITETAWAKGSPISFVDIENTFLPPLNEIQLPLPGEHQKINAALAIETVEALQRRLPVPEWAIIEGLSTVYWPGRMQVVNKGKNKIVLDGAHNPPAVRALKNAFKNVFLKQTPTLIVGILKDKDIQAIAQELSGLSDTIIAVEISTDRSARAGQIKEAFLKVDPSAKIICARDLKTALSLVQEVPLTLITGSLYLIGEAMELLGLSPTQVTDEKALNDWTINRFPR